MQKINRDEFLNKNIKKIHKWLRWLIQIIYFVFLPSVFTAAFSGVKYLFTQLGEGKRIELTSFVTALIVLCVFTIVFGRFFCGFACAFGSLGDAIHVVYIQFCKKFKKKPKKMPSIWSQRISIVKYVILAILVVMCFTGVYEKIQGMSPWDVFSMLHAGNLKLENYEVGIVLFILILVGMALEERFFCRFLCPMGAVFSLLPTFPFFTLRRNREQCLKGCKGCTMNCPSGIELPVEGSLEVSGDCFQCQKCIDTCPKQNIHCGIHKLKANEIVFTIFRAVLLLVLLLWIGV